MPINVAPQRACKSAGETRNIAVSFAGWLDTGEVLTGTPTIVEVGTSDLTLGNKVVSTGALTINGLVVPTGEAVQFNVSGGTAGTEYTIKITPGSDSTPAQTFVGNVILDVVAD